MRSIKYMWGITQAFLCLLLVAPGAHSATYTLNVYLPSAALQADFIANATNYFQGTISKGLFANTYSMTITGKKQAPPCGGQVVLPCNLDRNLALLVANSTKTYDYGFSGGMDEERWQTVNTLYGMQGKDFADHTCGGQPINANPDGAYVSTTTFHNSCLNAYNVIVSTINERWSYVFSSTGGVISK